MWYFWNLFLLWTVSLWPSPLSYRFMVIMLFFCGITSKKAAALRISNYIIRMTDHCSVLGWSEHNRTLWWLPLLICVRKSCIMLKEYFKDSFLNIQHYRMNGGLMVILKHLSQMCNTALFPQHGNFYFFIVPYSNVSLFCGKSTRNLFQLPTLHKTHFHYVMWHLSAY